MYAQIALEASFFFNDPNTNFPLYSYRQRDLATTNLFQNPDDRFLKFPSEFTKYTKLSTLQNSV